MGDVILHETVETMSFLIHWDAIMLATRSLRRGLSIASAIIHSKDQGVLRSSG